MEAMTLPFSTTARARAIANLIDLDPIMSGQIKEHISTPRLIECLDLPLLPGEYLDPKEHAVPLEPETDPLELVVKNYSLFHVLSAYFANLFKK